MYNILFIIFKAMNRNKRKAIKAPYLIKIYLSVQQKVSLVFPKLNVNIYFF